MDRRAVCRWWLSVYCCGRKNVHQQQTPVSTTTRTAYHSDEVVVVVETKTAKVQGQSASLPEPAVSASPDRPIVIGAMHHQEERSHPPRLTTAASKQQQQQNITTAVDDDDAPATDATCLKEANTHEFFPVARDVTKKDPQLAVQFVDDDIVAEPELVVAQEHSSLFFR